MHNILKRDENERINRTIKDLERIPHNNTKMYEAVKNINRMEPQQPLLIRGENGLTTNSTEQAKIVAEHFRNTFFKNAEPMDNIPETPIRTPFTVIEINKAVNKIKNKNPGYDEILELIKHSPLVIFQTIANIYNNMAETNDIPKEITSITNTKTITKTR